MGDGDRLRAEIDMLRARMLGLTDAILRISEDLDVDVVLQEVVDTARELTGARYGAIATLDDAGGLQDLVLSGLSPGQQQKVVGYDRGWELFAYLRDAREPLRTTDFVAHLESEGFSGFLPDIGAFLSTQIKVRDRHVGTIFIGEKHDDSMFTQEDEETLAMFAAQAAMAVTNARRYGDEQRAKADLEALVNTSPVGVLVVDVGSRTVVMANREARRIVGAPPAEARDATQDVWGLTCRRLDGSEIAYDELPVVRAVRDGETVQAEELVIERRDSTTVTALINASPIRSEDGELVSVVSTLQDMTPLEDLERLRGEFLAMVSHELRAPLTSIKGAAATVRDSSMPLDPAEVGQFFGLIEDQANHMRDLINDLLDMTRIEAGTLSVSPEPTDLAPVIDLAKSAFLSSGYRHSIDVDTASSLPLVWADRRRIAQVLHNLLSNAAANSREWSTITVSASLEDTHVAVSVIDQGAGIAPERLRLLFTKFSRVHSDDPHRPQAGYGLGLAICKGIVEAHGGRIRAHSKGEGHGTKFTFTIPTLDEPAVATDTFDGEAQPAPSKVETILVIDDDPQALRYVRNTLARAGYTPVVTSDPDELEHLLEAEKPHLVLLDLMLPATNAFDLIRRIPRILNVPVIILSGRGDDNNVAEAFELGASDYIVKPFSPTELLARIAAALRRQALSRHTEPYRVADLTVDYITRIVTVGGRAVKLTPTEYKLLSELCTNAGRALSYEQLLARIWEQESGSDVQRVRTLVKDLRVKLGDNARNPTYILTVPSVGYRAATP
ncbi:MAG: ATP-binding protein [Acidimicrobiaceae bacterium]|nr:ATP-binding protein [Acidimicrobiaceae bacterium]MDE0516219.1 ATP-binding protein [Acidimicrobiaceae bacterium]